MNNIKIVKLFNDKNKIDTYIEDIYNIMLQCSDETTNLAVSSKERIAEGFSPNKIKEGIGKNIYYICYLNNDEPIGVLGVHFNTRERFKHRASIGINILKKYWGKGYGNILVQNLIEDFNNNLFLKKLELEVRSDNIPAINLYKKYGFKIEGEISQYFHIDGKFISAYIMGLEK